MSALKDVLLGAFLRFLRGERRMTLAQGADPLRKTDATLRRIELAEVPVSDRDLETLLDHYGARGWQREQAGRLRALGSLPLRVYPDDCPMTSAILGYLVDRADTVRAWSRFYIPLPLESFDYVRLLLEPTAPLTDEQSMTVAAIRENDHKPTRCATVFIEQQVLYRAPGGSHRVMAQQIGRVLRLAQEQRVCVRIVSADTASPPVDTMVIELKNVRVTVEDMITFANYSIDQERLRISDAVLDSVAEMALDTQASARKLRAALDWHRRRAAEATASAPSGGTS
ncbi:Scr1 family TA system antitoxin-like transcriptional regulator [Streptomyces xiamenensis]|uniref:Scr1 family TA system antitoxin-like transcriptional regulator n=1 Tax=Streptomyces xiamenensis TaxID=408015 RepID=UPI0035D8C503